MWLIIRNYIFVLAHPFKIYDENFQRLHGVKILSLTESIVISWLCYILHVFLKVIFMSTVWYAFLNNYQGNFLVEMSNSLPIQTNNLNLLIYFSIFQAIFFPLSALVSYKVWSWIINLFERLAFARESRSGELIMRAAFSAHFFQVIPVLGGAVQTLFKWLIIFGGLRHQLGASVGLSAVIMIAPLTLVVILFTMPLFAIILLG